MKSLVILFMLLIPMAILGQAQDRDTVLIYVKRTNSEYIRTILSSTGVFNTYSIFTVTSEPTVPTICSAISPNGQFDARSQLSSPTTLSFLYTPTNEIFATIPWNPAWGACRLGWLDNETLVVRHIDTFEVMAMFQIEHNVLREVPVSLPPTPTIPELPFAYETMNQYFIPSNHYTKFVYETCPNEPTIPPNEYCEGDSMRVIYDTTLERNVGVITDSVLWMLSGYDLGGRVTRSTGYHSWSPDDRYFWYSTFNDDGFDDFLVYDTVAEQPLNTGGYNWTLDLLRNPIWSPDSRYAAFWMVGPPDYEITDPTIRSVNVYDTLTQQLIPLHLGLELGQYINHLVWSPNTPEFVTWDAAGNLYRVNVEARSQMLIDTAVTGVIAWSYTESIPTVELSTPTPTFTPTATLTPTATYTPAKTLLIPAEHV